MTDSSKNDPIARIRDLSRQVDALESRIAEEVSTQRLEIVGPEGEKRAWLAVDEDGSVALNLAGPDEAIHARLSVTDKGLPTLAFLGDAGRVLLALELKDIRYPVILLRGDDGKPDVRLGVNADGTAGVSISGSGLTERVELTVDNKGRPHLLLRDRDGQETSFAP